jgi:hypothetical protein
MLEDIGERLAGALKSRGNRRWEKSDHSAMMQDGIMSRSRVRNGIVEAVNSCIVQSDFTGSWRWKFSILRVEFRDTKCLKRNRRIEWRRRNLNEDE